MADYNDRLKDYIDVPTRMAAFYAKYPEGSIQSEIIEHIPGRWVERTFYDKNNKPYQAAVRSDGLITVKAWAYRTPDDPRPGIGHSWLEIPGTTPYTETSELENAETSAWGRAIAALGFEIRKSIASREEIASKQRETPRQAVASPNPTVAPRTTGPTPPRPDYVSELQFKNLQETAERHLGKGNGSFKVALWCRMYGCDEKTTTREQWKTMMEWIVNGEPEHLAAQREPGDEPLSTDIDAALGVVHETMDRVGAQNHGGANISQAQSKRLYAIAKGNKQLLKDTLAQFGFEHDRDIPKGPRYDAICKALEDAQVGDAPQDSPDIDF